VEVAITKVAVDPQVFTGFVRDVTDRTTAERERRRLLERELAAREQAESANRAKDEFLATLSHELRTPLNAIVGWTRMLLDGTLDEATSRRALQIIDRNAHTQVQLVEDILDVSRIITGKLSLDVRPVDLGAIIGMVLESVSPAAEAKQIRLWSTLAPSARNTMADPKRLQQIIWNLISNALRFTPQGGSVGVELSDCGANNVCIKITDTGAGIAPEFLPHLFERFSQADSSTTRQHGGLGLGLAIVRHLTELHGGTVKAESQGRGTGATFTVELPKLAFHGVKDTAAKPAADSVVAGDVSPLSGCRVLLVEDEPDARELIATILTKAGAVVETAISVDQAIESIERTPPDVLLSDIGLAGDDGYALIRQVRAREIDTRRRLPSAAVTAYARQEDRERALDAGFDGYVAKPVDPDVMIATIRSLWKAR
jgi:signal transduction histidine kinase